MNAILQDLTLSTSKTDFESAKMETQALRTQVQKLEAEARQLRETAQFNFGSGTDAFASKQWDVAEKFFKTVIDKYPTDPLVEKAQEKLLFIQRARADETERAQKAEADAALARETEFAESDEPIDYETFYAKTRTGLQRGKRFRFNACLSNALFISGGKYDDKYIINTTDQFDDNREYENFLKRSNKYCGTIVASMLDGQVAIHRLH